MTTPADPPSGSRPDAGRIASVHATVLRVPLDRQLRAYGSDSADVVLVTATDADGCTGTGFTYTLGIGSLAVRSMVNDVLAPLARGTSTANWPATYAEFGRQTRRLGKSVFAPAISAIDTAVWDLRGRRAGLPLFRLLGREPSRVPIYGSGRSSNTLSTPELVHGSVSYAADGYDAVKLRVGARSPEDDLARVAAVRAELGDQVRLMVDCNEQLTLDSARWLAPRLADLAVHWIEEPFPAEDLAAHRALAQHSPVAVAVGEHLVGRHEFGHYIDAGAAGVLQPDAALTGGITEGVRIAALAVARGVPVSFHSLPELHVHLAMGDANVVYVEDFPVIEPLLAESLTPVQSRVSASETPGHGIAWDVDALKRYELAD